MKCLKDEDIQKYIDGEMPNYKMKKIDKHLDKCDDCMARFSYYCENLEIENKIALEKEIDLDKSFSIFKEKLELPKGENKMKNKRKLVPILATACVIFVEVPVLASDTIKEFFRTNVFEDRLVNQGQVREDGSVVEALEGGNFVEIDKKITNNGITVHITDLFVAKTRISVNYRLEDENGNLLPYTFNTEGLDIKDDGIENGKQLYPPTYYTDKEKGLFSVMEYIKTDNNENAPFNLLKDGKSLINNGIGIREVQKDDTTEWNLSFVGFEDIAYPVVIDIDINKIGETIGEWKGQIEIREDMLSKESN